MPCACIDIGSNTTRLLVAELRGPTLVEVLSERAFTQVGRAGPEGEEAELARLQAVVAAQALSARKAGARSLCVVATAAIRRAPSRERICAALEQAAGAEVLLLSGEDEARLAFHGAVGTLPEAPAGTIGVVDVGGGSTELAVGTASIGVEWWRSLPVGSGDLTLGLLLSDPPRGAELEDAARQAAAAFAGVEAPPVEHAVAVGGSAGSLRAVVGDVIDAETLAQAVLGLTAGPAAVIADRLGLRAERVRLLPAGMLLLARAAELFGRPLLIGRGGVREGVLLERLARLG